MAYLALYRAWRPRRFNEVVGQGQTVTALHNAVKEKKVAHAYLFAGPRGTGKTSLAKILAKAVNCEDLQEGEPCNLCSNCLDINQGNFMDVIEIDAASNRGIDEIRDLREKVRVLPAQGKYKVYIIDEVHMLTTEAFNALLKTIEEPPASVIFILATTEAQKIPATIRSRCQNYNFRRLTNEEIINRLNVITADNGINLDGEAALLIARRASGSLRDALSVLDQLTSYKGQVINKADVLDILGLVDNLFLARLLDAVIAGDTNNIIRLLGLAISEGKEARQIAEEMSLYLRDIMLYAYGGGVAELLVATNELLPFMDRQKEGMTKDDIINGLQIMLDTGERLRYKEGQRFLLELGFLELAQAFTTSTKAPTVSLRGEVGRESVQNFKQKSEKDEAKEILWQKILANVKEIKIPTHALLSQGNLLGAKDNVVYIGFKKGFKFHKERMEERGNKEIVVTVLEEIFNRQVEIEFIFIDDEYYNDIMVKKAIEFFGEEIVEIND